MTKIREYKTKDVVYELGEYWILDKGDTYEIYKAGLTHSIRCGVTSKTLGLARAVKSLVLHKNNAEKKENINANGNDIIYGGYTIKAYPEKCSSTSRNAQ